MSEEVKKQEEEKKENVPAEEVPPPPPPKIKITAEMINAGLSTLCRTFDGNSFAYGKLIIEVFYINLISKKGKRIRNNW